MQEGIDFICIILPKRSGFFLVLSKDRVKSRSILFFFPYFCCKSSAFVSKNPKNGSRVKSRAYFAAFVQSGRPCAGRETAEQSTDVPGGSQHYKVCLWG